MDKTFKDIVETTIRYHSAELARNLDASKVLQEMIKNMPKPPRLTRWQKLVRWFRVQPERIRDAWRVLKGEDMHIEWWDDHR